MVRFRGGLPVLGGLLLAACGTPKTQDGGATNATAADNATPVVNAPAPADAPSPVASASASASPIPVATGIVSCDAEAGARAAKVLVQQCLSVSPATHPPCNAQNSCAMIRSEITRACSVIDDGGAPVDGCIAPAGVAAAAETLRIYYAAIDARDYVTAWQLWDGDGARSGKSLDAFERGFARTVASEVTLGTPDAPEGAAGSSYVTIPVTVSARLSDGTRQRFSGSYVLRRSNVERSQGWHLYSATLKPAA
jgi:hypothetical protein